MHDRDAFFALIPLRVRAGVRVRFGRLVGVRRSYAGAELVM